MDLLWNKSEGIIKKISVQQKIAFIGALIAGFLSHGYALGNNYIYHDATILNGLGTTFGLGRWALGYVGMIDDLLLGNYNLPFLNVVLSIILIAVSTMVVIDILEVDGKFLSAFIGAVFAVYPVVTSTFAYNFSATFYFIALLLSVVAIKVMKDGVNEKKIKACIVAALLIALSAGFYQAYLSVSVTLALTLVMMELISDKANNNDNEAKSGSMISPIVKGIIYAITLIAGLVIYLIINTISNAIMKPPATGYQGAEDMGSMSFAKIPARFIQTYLHFFYIKWNGINKAMCMWLFIIAFIIIAAFVIISGLAKNKVKKANILLFILCLALMPIAVNLVYLMSTSENFSVHTLMRFATVFVLITPAVLMEKMKRDESVPAVIASILLIAITFGYIYSNNIAYLKMNLVQEEMTSFFTVLETRISQVEGYSDETPIIFVGESKIVDNNLYDLNEVYKDTVILGYEYNATDLINKESWKRYMAYHAGFAPDIINVIDAPESILNSEELANLSVYPDADSIAIIDGTIVVKLSE